MIKQYMERIDAAADNTNPGAMANRFRDARHQLFEQHVLADFLTTEGQPFNDKPVTILDAGGTPDYWANRLGDLGDHRIDVTVINLSGAEFDKGRRSPHVKEVIGDVTKLMTIFGPKSFDIVYSNSVIEHVGDLSNQRTMGEQVRSVGNAYFLQTPTRSFPIEPHFRHPLAHPYLPHKLRQYGLRNARPGIDPADIISTLDEVRLMTAAELKSALPDATIHREKFYGLTKSWMAFRRRQAEQLGYDQQAAA